MNYKKTNLVEDGAVWAEEGVLGQVPVGPVVIDTNMEHLAVRGGVSVITPRG